MIGRWLEGEVAMSTVIDLPHRHNFDRHQLWDRFERADLFEHYLDLQAQGVSQRQAAKQLQVPRTTLQAWQSWHDTLDICPHVAQFFQSGPGLAFLHRLVLALHLICVAVGACGIRLVCLLLNLTGLDRFVAASYGAQHQVNVEVEQAIVAYQQTETPRLAKAMPRKVITMTQDETFTGGLCLVASDPVSNFIILEQLAQSRDQATWHALMAPALAQLNCEVIQSTSVEAQAAGKRFVLGHREVFWVRVVSQAYGFIVMVGHHRLFHLAIDLLLSPIGGHNKAVKACQIEEETDQANAACPDFNADEMAGNHDAV